MIENVCRLLVAATARLSPPEETLQVPRMDLGKALPKQNLPGARASSAPAPNLLHKYLLLL